MKKYLKLQFLLLVFIVALSTAKGVEEKLFRSNKLNMIWLKLQNKMSSYKLNKLEHDLREQDDKYMNWKELKVHGGDADGEIEANLRRSLFKILEKYGHEKMLGKAPDPPSEPGVEDNTLRTDEYFSDIRLKKLWELARNHGKFDEVEMSKLKTEFEHHKERIHEYNMLLNTLQEQHGISANSLNSHDKLKDREIDHLKMDLKDKYVAMKKHYKQLKERVTGEVVQSPFRDYRVIELWEKAKNNHFTEKELESLKEELHHFETKLGKHEHFKNAAKKSERKLNAGEYVDHEIYKDYAKKAKEHLKYVKKLHHTLLEKVSKRDEL